MKPTFVVSIMFVRIFTGEIPCDHYFILTEQYMEFYTDAIIVKYNIAVKSSVPLSRPF